MTILLRTKRLLGKSKQEDTQKKLRQYGLQREFSPYLAFIAILVVALFYFWIERTNYFHGASRDYQQYALDMDKSTSIIKTKQIHCKLKRVLERNAQNKIEERANWFDNAIDYEKEHFRTVKNDRMEAGILFAPYYPCLDSLTKTTSVKDLFDGGKWVCGLKELSQKKGRVLVYSFGSQWNVEFEDFVNKQVNGNTEVHIYDPTMGDEREKLKMWIDKLPSNFNFHEIAVTGSDQKSLTIGSKEYQASTLVEAMIQNGHSEGIDILKFDVEGAEYEILENTDWNSLKIGMILFEFHTNIISHQQGKDYTMLQFEAQLSKMEKAGYRLYSTEPVCGNCNGQFEVSLIHKDWSPITGFDDICHEEDAKSKNVDHEM